MQATSLVPLDSLTVRPAAVAWSPQDTRVTDNGWWTDGKLAIQTEYIRGDSRLAKRLTDFYQSRAAFGPQPVPLAIHVANFHARSIPCEILGVHMRADEDVGLKRTRDAGEAAPWVIVRCGDKLLAFNAWFARALATVRPEEWRVGTHKGQAALLAYRAGKPVALAMAITLPDEHLKRVSSLVA